MKSDLSLARGDDPVARAALGPALDVATRGDKGLRVFVRADKAVAYGGLMTVMNALRDAGYLKVALVGLADEGAGTVIGGAAPTADTSGGRVQ